MDFGKKKIIRTFAKKVAQNFASVFAKRKTKRDAKNARRAFFVLKQFLRQKFSFFLRKSPYFWGKKLRLLKKSIFIYRKSINPQSIFVKPNTPSLCPLCLYNLLGFLGCSLLLGFPLAPTLRAGASPSRGSFCSLRSHPNGCRGAPL